MGRGLPQHGGGAFVATRHSRLSRVFSIKPLIPKKEVPREEANPVLSESTRAGESGLVVVATAGEFADDIANEVFGIAEKH